MDHTGAGDPDFMARARADGEALGAALRAVEESMKGQPVHDVEDRLIDELRARGAFMRLEEIQHHALVISDPEWAIRNPEGLENRLAGIHDPDRAQQEAEVEAQLGHTVIRLSKIVESMWRVRRTAVSARRTMDGVEFEIRIDPWSRRRAAKLTRAAAPAAVSVVPFQKPPSN